MSKVIEEQEMELEIDEGNEEAPKVKTSKMFGHDSDQSVNESSKRIFDKIYEVEGEELDEEGEVSTVDMEDEEGVIPFDSQGEQRGIIIYPVDNRQKYSILFMNDYGALIKSIDNIKGPYRANVKFDAGQYNVVIKSRGNNLPYTAKVI